MTQRANTGRLCVEAGKGGGVVRAMPRPNVYRGGHSENDRCRLSCVSVGSCFLLRFCASWVFVPFSPLNVAIFFLRGLHWLVKVVCEALPVGINSVPRR